MIPSYRHAFNSRFTSEKYDQLRREMTSRCGVDIPFPLCETPCFFPNALVARMGEDGKALIRQLVENPEYHARSEASIPAKFRVPNEPSHPMFIQVDFGLVRIRRASYSRNWSSYRLSLPYTRISPCWHRLTSMCSRSTRSFATS